MQAQSLDSDFAPETLAPSDATKPPSAKARRRANPFRLGGELPSSLYWLLASGTFALVFGLWCFFSYTGRVSSLILPTPTAVVSSAARLWHAGELWPDIKISVFRISAGFLASAVWRFRSAF